jgi:putative endonuclease
MFKKPSLGAEGELLAKKYLISAGYRILETNFRNTKGKQLGEIDIIAKENDELVFIEVKTRIGEYGKSILPESNITPCKLSKINKVALIYIKIKNLWDKKYRFDAVSVYIHPQTKNSTINHIKNIYF